MFHRGVVSAASSSSRREFLRSREFLPLAVVRSSSSSSYRCVSIRGGGAGTALFSSSSSSGDPSQLNESERRTGWMHNPPKGKKDINDDTTTTTELRTGWLHNKKAPSKVNVVSPTTATTTGGESKAQLLLKRAKEKAMTNHRILASPTYHACGEGRQAVITEHSIDVPLQHNNDDKDDGERLSVYFSIVEEIKTEEDAKFFESLRSNDGNDVNLERKRADRYVEEYAKLTHADNAILYLQGGPGFGAPAPISGIGLSDGSSWVAAALSQSQFHRVILMDQRGTGRSTPITKQTLELKFPNLFAMDDNDEKTTTSNDDIQLLVTQGLEDATEYMTYFRADSIVQDAELVKQALLLPNDKNDNDDKAKPWGAALGQSFGGFCLMTYLSKVDHPPKICLFTGGIAPMLTPIDTVYSSLWKRVKKRNYQYYQRYPGDVSLVKSIVKQLPATLPSGGILTPRRFLQLGIGLGSSPSSFASLHTLLQSAFVTTTNVFSRSFLKQFDTVQSWDDAPIYFLLHESIYANGKQLENSNPTQWSAHRTNTDPDFHYESTSNDDDDDDECPTLLYGEMVFPWMADGDYAELSGYGMKALAQALANKSDWGDLYHADHMRQVLSSNGGKSKAAAAVYYDDMYVDFNACMKVTDRGGPLEQCKVWITNDYQHSGLRDDGATIFTKLLGMAKGSINTPS